MNTCGKCHFYEAAVGTGKDEQGNEFPVGTCFGAPPSVTNGKTEYPTVREDRRACALWVLSIITAAPSDIIAQMKDQGGIIPTSSKRRKP